MSTEVRSSNPRVQRYRIQQNQGEYCLKGCDDGDLVDWNEYDYQRRRGDILNAELSGFMAAATKREAAQTAEIERLHALVKKAGDLLTYGAPDMELQSDDGSDWLAQCDEWFKAADYGQPRPADETSGA